MTPSTLGYGQHAWLLAPTTALLFVAYVARAEGGSSHAPRPFEVLAGILSQRGEQLSGTDVSIATRMAEDLAELSTASAVDVDVKTELVRRRGRSRWRCSWSARPLPVGSRRRIAWQVDLDAAEHRAIAASIRRESEGMATPGSVDPRRASAIRALLEMPDLGNPGGCTFDNDPGRGDPVAEFATAFSGRAAHETLRFGVSLTPANSSDAPLGSTFCLLSAGHGEGEDVSGFDRGYLLTPDGHTVVSGSVVCATTP